MDIITYNNTTIITPHFNSNEFKCPHCGISKISTNLVKKLENLFTYVNASKCIISSGYRCREYDVKMNGYAGNGKIIDAIEIN